MKQLPDTLWELLTIALEDLEKVEKDPRYTVNMCVWHEPQEEDAPPDTCSVCLAGSVLAKTLNISPTRTVEPIDFDTSIENKLEAIDNIIAHEFADAISIIYGPSKDIPIEIDTEFTDINNHFTLYSQNPKLFKKNMRAVAKIFKKYNL